MTDEPTTRQKPEITMVPVDQLEVGDIIQKLGFIAGVEWFELVTAIDPQPDGGAIVYSTHFPLLGKAVVQPRALMPVAAHDEDALKRALRMFSDD